MAIKVKVTSGDPRLSELLLRQTPSRNGQWGKCEFYVNQFVERCDWWVVCHSSSLKYVESAWCDPGHLIYISMEPSEGNTPVRFYEQFAKVVLCDERINHRDILIQNATTWWAGIEVRFDSGHKFSPLVREDYDTLKIMKVPPKQNRVSVITSNRELLPGHRKRLGFIKRLRRHPLAKHIDFYGGGHNPVLDKLEALLPYKYHLALENCAIPHYWSEKLGDSYLAFTVPIYYGCTNIEKYFPEQALVKIDIDDFDSVIKTLDYVISDDIYAQRYPYIHEARKLVLDKYNIFEMMAGICTAEAVHFEQCTIKPLDQFVGSWPRRLARQLLLKISR